MPLRAFKFLALFVLVSSSVMWAVREERAARLSFAGSDSRQTARRRPSVRSATVDIPETIRFTDAGSRGLVISTWINGAGPFDFAIDTGVGTTIISARVAGAARIERTGRRVDVGGMAGGGTLSGEETNVNSIALGTATNRLPSAIPVIVAASLPPGLDGILEPTDAFRPFGYTIDMPRRELTAFNPNTTPIRNSDAGPDGVVAKWIYADSSRRPFVMLDLGKPALIDTGSSLGLAMTEAAARAAGVSEIGASSSRTSRDVGQGSFTTRRVRAIDISIGSLSLQHIPTDIIGSATPDAPIILGRDALRPFFISFDPVHRLILITPSRG